MRVIKVGAAWCSGCLVMKPRWQELEAENPWLKTEFYDYDEHPEIAKTYAIDENLPVAIFVSDDGRELQRLTGEVSKDDIQATIEALRNK